MAICPSSIPWTWETECGAQHKPQTVRPRLFSAPQATLATTAPPVSPRQVLEDEVFGEVNQWTDAKRALVYKMLYNQGLRIDACDAIVRKAFAT